MLGTKKLCSAQKNCARYRNFGARYRNFCAQWYGMKNSSYQPRTTLVPTPYQPVPTPYQAVPPRTKTVPTPYQLRTSSYQLRTSSYQAVPPRTKGIFACSSHSDEGLASGFEFPGSRVFRSTVPPDFQLNCCLFNRVVRAEKSFVPSVPGVPSTV